MTKGKKNPVKNPNEPPAKRTNLELDPEALNDSMGEILEEIGEKETKTVDDLYRCLSTFIKLTMSKENERRELRLKVIELEEKTVNHDVALNSLTLATKNLDQILEATRTKTKSLEKSANLIDQKRVDNDVFVSLFAKKPRADVIAKNLVKIATLPENSIHEAYTIPINATPNANSTRNHSNESHAQKYAVIVSFKDIRDKKKLLSARRDMGPIKLAQLLPNAITDKNSTIKISNRLSAFNLKALKCLLKAKAQKRIHEFKLHNGLFKVWRTESEKWEYWHCDEQIDELTETPEQLSMDTTENN